MKLNLIDICYDLGSTDIFPFKAVFYGQKHSDTFHYFCEAFLNMPTPPPNMVRVKAF